MIKRFIAEDYSFILPSNTLSRDHTCVEREPNMTLWLTIANMQRVHILTLKKCWHSRWTHPNLQKMLMTFAGRLRPSFILSGKGSQVAKGVESQSHFSSAAGKSEKVSLGERGSWDGQSGIKSVIRCQIFSALVLFRTPSWTYNNCPSVVVLYLYFFFQVLFPGDDGILQLVLSRSH